jgi:hypothetical protein
VVSLLAENYFSRNCSAKSHVKPPSSPKILQLDPDQHLANKRNVARSYAPLDKMDIEGKRKPRQKPGLRSLKIHFAGH